MKIKELWEKAKVYIHFREQFKIDLDFSIGKYFVWIKIVPIIIGFHFNGNKFVWSITPVIINTEWQRKPEDYPDPNKTIFTVNKHHMVFSLGWISRGTYGDDTCKKTKFVIETPKLVKWDEDIVIDMDKIGRVPFPNVKNMKLIIKDKQIEF